MTICIDTWTRKLEQDPMLHPAMILDTPIMMTAQKGIYAFTEKDWPNFFVYVGSAIGREGLYQRIVRQHLNPRYLETRAKKHIAGKDDFQLQPGNHEIIQGKVAIEKSSFRRSLAREQQLRAGQECVAYIVENFMLQYIPLPELSNEEIREIERGIISKTKPLYNEIYK